VEQLCAHLKQVTRTAVEIICDKCVTNIALYVTSVLPIIRDKCVTNTALKQKERRTESAEITFSREFTGYTLYNNKINEEL
jgi:hypothetical protein